MGEKIEQVGGSIRKWNAHKCQRPGGVYTEQ